MQQAHKQPNHNQGRSRGVFGHDAYHRHKQHRQQEQSAGDYRRQAGSAALLNTGGGLNVRRRRRCAAYRTEHRCPGVKNQKTVYTLDRAVFFDHARLRHHGKQRADTVKHVNKHQRKDAGKQAPFQRPDNVQL